MCVKGTLARPGVLASLGKTPCSLNTKKTIYFLDITNITLIGLKCSNCKVFTRDEHNNLLTPHLLAPHLLG